MTQQFNMRVLLSVVFLLMTSWLTLAQSSEALQVFDRGDYAEAARLYEAQLSNSPEADANLYYNLGVCYAQMGHIVDAATNYERALYINPTHMEARHNLKILYSRVKGSIPIERGMIQSLSDSFCYRLPISIWIFMAITFFVLTLSLVFCFFLSQNIRTRRVLFYSSLGTLLLVILANAAIAHQWYYRRAIESKVIVSQVYRLHSNPSKSNPKDVEVHEGTPAQALSTLGVWTQVRLPNGVEGWLPNESIEYIIKPASFE